MNKLQELHLKQKVLELEIAQRELRLQEGVKHTLTPVNLVGIAANTIFGSSHKKRSSSFWKNASKQLAAELIKRW